MKYPMLSITNKPVKFKVVKLLPQVYYLEFKTKKDLTSTLLRFQEHYESPKFRNKIFSLKEFVDWYKTTRKGRFTYFSDWSGFNFPSFVLKPFYDGKMPSLTHREKQILDLFKKETKEFYVIATFKTKVKKKEFLETKKHEIAHSQYYLNKNYKKAVDKILAPLKLKPVFNYLKGLGYHKKVWIDESHAYLLTDKEALVEEKISLKPYNEAMNQLEKCYQKHVEKNL